MRKTYFNSRPSARGDARIARISAVPRTFQFTPLREGRREVALEELYGEGISIHAPPRGATGIAESEPRRLAISIHAPPRGATNWDGTSDLAIAFQFTPLREGRPDGYDCRRIADGFQFTPLREGRHGERVRFAAWRYFNSRPSARGDGADGSIIIDTGLISIHAPPRGAT